MCVICGVYYLCVHVRDMWSVLITCVSMSVLCGVCYLCANISDITCVTRFGL